MKLKIEKKIKSLFKYVFTYMFFIMLFLILLILSCMIPVDIIKGKATESADILVSEGNRKITYIPYKGFNMQFDNYSDALMLNTAYSIDTSSPLYSAMIARKNYIPGITEIVEQDSVSELKSASKYKYHDEVGELKDLVNKDITESFEYARYWHGYLVVLRVLLIFANVTTIRIIFTIIFTVLAGILLYQLYKKINLDISFIFFVGLVAVEYFYIGISIQSSFVFMIMMIESLFILFKYKKIKDIGLVFFISAMLTNFFDLLTVPIITYGIPLLVYFLMLQKEDSITIKEIILIFLKTRSSMDNGICYNMVK